MKEKSKIISEQNNISNSGKKTNKKTPDKNKQTPPPPRFRSNYKGCKC